MDDQSMGEEAMKEMEDHQEPVEAREEPMPSTSSEKRDEISSMRSTPSLRSDTPKSSTSVRPSEKKKKGSKKGVNAFYLCSPEGIKIKRVDVEEVEPFEEEIYEKEGKKPLIPTEFNDSWISFKLEHFYQGIKFRSDSDYIQGENPCPVPIESGFKRYYCTAGGVTLRDIREMLEKKFCTEKKFTIYLIHPNIMGVRHLDDKMTLNMLANETKWQRKRPLRILFTMIPPKEPPPSLEKETAVPAPPMTDPIPVEEDDVQIINPPMLPHQTQVGLTPNQMNRTPELQKQLQAMQMMTPQCHQMLTSGLLAQRMQQQAPMKRKREDMETTPHQLHPAQIAQMHMNHQQQHRQMHMQQQRHLNAQSMTPHQLQQLTMYYQKQQAFIMPPEVKNARIATMASSLTNPQQSQSLFPVTLMSNSQMKSMPPSAKGASIPGPSGQSSTPQNQQNAALLRNLLLQQQQQQQQNAKHQAQQQQKKLWEQHQARQIHPQMMHAQAAQLSQQLKAQQVRLQQDAVFNAQRLAHGKEHSGPPPAKKMALQEALETPPRFQQPVLINQSPLQLQKEPKQSPQSSSHSTPTLAAQLEKTLPVPSPPSPPKQQSSMTTPSPPAISPIPPKLTAPRATPEADKLKPYAAQVVVQPITNVNQPLSKTSSPAPALSPAIPMNNSIDIGTMAKMKNQSLGRTLKDSFAKNNRNNQQSIPLDGIRAQHIDGQLQISVPSGHLELLRNSTIVPTL